MLCSYLHHGFLLCAHTDTHINMFLHFINTYLFFLSSILSLPPFSLLPFSIPFLNWNDSVHIVCVASFCTMHHTPSPDVDTYRPKSFFFTAVYYSTMQMYPILFGHSSNDEHSGSFQFCATPKSSAINCFVCTSSHMLP